MTHTDINGTQNERNEMEHGEEIANENLETRSEEHLEVCSCCGEPMTSIEVLESYLEQRIEQALEACDALSAEYGKTVQFELSEKVRMQLEERQNVESLLKENKTLKSNNTENQEKIASLEEQVSKLDTQLKQSITTRDRIELSEGHSTDLIENRISLGLSNVYSTGVYINLNNEQQEMDIGNSEDFTYAGEECILELERVEPDASPPKAEFSFGCEG